MKSKKVTALVALAVLVAGVVALRRATTSNGTSSTDWYAPQRQHPWNRLHETLIVRRSTDGRRFGDHELDPLLWPDSNHLLTGHSGKLSLQVLDEFLAKHEDQRIRDPLKRALLQHDLWGLFDWLADPALDRWPEQRRRLRQPLAQLIRRLALSAEEIQGLPDNYDAVVTAEVDDRPAREHDARQLLPNDLFDADGPWVQLAYVANGRLGTAHEENAATRGRSAFLMFLRLPDDGVQPAELLDRFSVWADDESRRDPETSRRAGDPPFELPPGTQVALVRRLLLIDQYGSVQPTSITERVQIRVLDEATPEDQVDKPQRFRLFQLNRHALMTGNTDQSLNAVSASERGFELGPIRTPATGDPFSSGAQELPPTTLMETCTQCHKHHGLLAWARQSFSALGTRPRNLSIQVQERGDAAATAAWKAARPEFEMLRAIVKGIEPFRE
jgi:hypothetical protein